MGIQQSSACTFFLLFAYFHSQQSQGAAEVWTEKGGGDWVGHPRH
jgi:hypothetical protein